MRWLFWAEKIFYAVLAFAAAFYFITLFKAWGQEKQGYFLFVGDFESAILVFAIALAVGFVLEKLLKWEIRKLFGFKGGGRR